jgi:prophage antirepressor-like protein
MNDIVLFTFETRQLRSFLDEAGDPHFVAADVLTILE